MDEGKQGSAGGKWKWKRDYPQLFCSISEVASRLAAAHCGDARVNVPPASCSQLCSMTAAPSDTDPLPLRPEKWAKSMMIYLPPYPQSFKICNFYEILSVISENLVKFRGFFFF